MVLNTMEQNGMIELLKKYEKMRRRNMICVKNVESVYIE